MAKIYLPTAYVNSPCKVVNSNYIRAYTNNQLTNYVDIYVNQDYMLKEGYSSYGFNGTCDTLNTYTDDFYYRTDFTNILICLTALFFFIVIIPTRAFKKLFKKGVV